MLKNLSLAIAFSSLLACEKASKTEKNSLNDTLSYTNIQFLKQNKGCIKEDSLCATVKIDYQEFNVPKLNDVIKNDILKLFENETAKAKSFESLSENFILDYEKQKQEQIAGNKQDSTFTISGMPWHLEIQSHCDSVSNQYIFNNTNTYQFMGGAHPVSFQYYFVYDKNNFKRITLEDIFKVGFDQKLLKIAENIFRQNEKLNKLAKLDDSNGYFFENGKFLLNDNFTFSKTGIKFYYNVYEIKPYVAGPTILEIPFSIIKDLLK